MLINSSLDQLNASLGDISFSDGKSNIPIVYQRRITDVIKKCTGLKKNGGRVFWMKIGVDFWVKMKKDGLEIDVKSGILNY